MNSRLVPDMENTPAACFQRLCQVLLDGSSKDLNNKNVEDFRVILHMIMHECSKANIETGKIWVFEHCHTATHANALLDYILSLASSRKSQEERIHLIYLVNDILFHTARKQLPWMRDAMLPLLAPLLRLAYDVAESPEYKAKVIKVLSFWGDQNIFDSNVIHQIRQDVTGQLSTDSHHQPQPIQQQTQLIQQHHQIKQQRIPINPPQPPRNYYELPAGLMLLAQTEDYKPIDPSTLKFPFPRPPPTQELLSAVDDYYKGLKTQDDLILDDKSEIDAQGWEKGYLDSYFQSLLQKRQDREKSSSSSSGRFSAHHHQESRGRSSSRDAAAYRYEQRRHSPFHRSYSSRSYSSSPQRSRSPRRSSPLRRGRSPRPRSPIRSPRRSSPDIRGRSPPRSPMRRSSPRRLSPRRLSPRRLSPRRLSPRRISPRRASPNRASPRRSSPPRERYRQSRYSRSRSPPLSSFQPNFQQPALQSQTFPTPIHQSIQPAPHQQPSFQPSAFVQQPTFQQPPYQKPQSNYNSLSHRGERAPENRYLGLGNASDEFDSFRRNKSQAYSKREPHQPMTCYKCNKVGHLARECSSL